jgi:hypothetical protein
LSDGRLEQGTGWRNTVTLRGATAKPSIKRLIIKPACAGPTWSAAPMAVSAGRLMSMPKDGKATRKLNSKLKAMEAGGTRTDRVSLG